MQLSQSQRKKLEKLARNAKQAYIRRKALVLLNLAKKYPVSLVADMFYISRQSVYNWRQRYLEEGIKGLYVKPGRGRKSNVDLNEIKRYVRQTPRNFGLRITRWTLKALAQAVPSLKGFTPPGVRKVLVRCGFRYKRGQPRLHSPDPQYDVKKTLGCSNKTNEGKSWALCTFIFG